MQLAIYFSAIPDLRLGNIILLTPLKINYKTQKTLNTKKLVKIL